MNKNRFAFISHIFPPSPSGQAVALYRILRGFDPNLYYLINSNMNSAPIEYGDDSFQLAAKYYYLSPEPKLKRPNRFCLSIIRNTINIFFQIFSRTKNIVKIIHREPGTRAVIACTGDIVDIPAGFLASKITKLPFFVYLFDDYVYQWCGVQRSFAKQMASIIFHHSAGVIGPNEYICEEYQNRYGISTTLVRNPFGADELSDQPDLQWPFKKEKIKIIYTGAIYHANYDCFCNLIQAMDDLPNLNLELHIYTSQAPDELETHGIKSNQIVFHAHVPYQEIVEQQLKADILFLPLAFESPIPEVIRTSAPGKMGEYLISGRPVLAHVPGNSFVANFFTNHKCGWLADQNNAGNLAAVIMQIITQPEQRRLLIQNARKIAALEFSPELAREQLVNRLLGEPHRE